MKKLGTLVLWFAMVAVLAPLSSAQQIRYYWFYPANSGCSVYTFDPNSPGSRERAYRSCTKLEGKPCYEARGSALPAC